MPSLESSYHISPCFTIIIVHVIEKNNLKFLSFMSAKTLYSLLPALLDTNPFSSEEKEKEKEKDGAQGAEGEEKRGGDGEVDDVSALPPKVAGLVEVYRCSLTLSREACLSPPLTSQTFGYLFFFTNTSLLNTLLERGERVTVAITCREQSHY